MKKILASFAFVIFMFNMFGCQKTDNLSDDTSKQINAPTSDSTTSESNNNTDNDDDWNTYNERAEAFVTTIANGDFESATEMFDSAMKESISILQLQDIWEIILKQAGTFIAVQKIENKLVDGYFVCFTTSQHENSGVILRIVFSEDGLVTGLFIDGYPKINNIVKSEKFTDYPIIIGEGTNFPLNGILSIPDNIKNKVPAVVLVHGSGPQDMDETIYSNKPFRDIAEYLASNGIAVIRYDKRTYAHGAKIAKLLGNNATIKEETIDDAILATKMLKDDPRIDENKIFILGHSLGGMLAPRIHSEGGDYAGLILLAGSPRSLLDISYDQNIAYINEMPESDEKTNALLQMESYDEQIKSLKLLSDEEAKNTPMSGGVSFYYYKEMDEQSVSEYIKSITKPFLVLQGSKDFQVYPEKDFAIYNDLLGKRMNATLKLYEGLNHYFMPSTGKTIAEYQEEYKTKSNVDKQVLRDIEEWIKAN